MKLNEIEYNGKKYPIAFDLNVMEQIQDEFGTINNWSELTSAEEPKIKAVIFGFWAMINEGIEIWNEEHEDKLKPMSLKQVGRMITDVGMAEATGVLQGAVVDSVSDDEEKNA